MSFNSMNLAPALVSVLTSHHLDTPTPIQSAVIPSVMKNRDVFGVAAAGTGKTLAYLLPTLSRVFEDVKAPQVMIVVPTRELALQVYGVAQEYCQALNLSLTLLSGGKDRQKEIDTLQSGVQVIVATLGRLHDLTVKESVVSMRTVTQIVLDEADMMVDRGFYDLLLEVVQKLPVKHQTLVLSAQIPQRLKQFVEQFLHRPEIHNLTLHHGANDNTQHVFVPRGGKSKTEALLAMLPGINPFVALIFASKVETVNEVASAMITAGYRIGILHGDMAASERKAMLKRVADHEFTYVVASDVVARGIDIPGITHVINVDLPYDLEFYFHRAGRTGRLGGSQGIVFTFFDATEQARLEKLVERRIKYTYQTYKNSEWTVMNRRMVRPTKKVSAELDGKIKKAIAKTKTTTVKPGYKKKVQRAVEEVKRKHRREKIREDIKAKIKERASVKSKAEKEMSSQ